MILLRLGKKPALRRSHLGPLNGSADQLIEQGLVERFAPDNSGSKNAIRLTAAGETLLRALLKKDA